MSLSSNSIIHFTNNKEALKGILTDNFKLSYCIEKVKLNAATIEFAAPMVSFCDIPLSQVKHHITKYGAYGIGLTKEWAEKQKLNPVVYIEKKSNLAQSYLNIYTEYILNTTKNLFTLNEKEKSVIDILRYIKNYQDDLTRGGTVHKDYRFSDEREWRYVLDYNSQAQYIYALDSNFNKETANKTLSTDRLMFEPNDIKYVIIEKESEILEFLNLFRDAKGKNYSHHDVERLMTRIITTEQIVQDF